VWQIFIGSISLSLIHALIPNHWIPFVTIGKSERWTTSETLAAAAIAGIAHILSTIIIGIIVGFIGYKLAGYFEVITTTVAPVILIGIGIIYLILDLYWSRRHHHHHEHLMERGNGNSKAAIITSLAIAMFFSPCIELEAYYFQAGTLGWTGIISVSAVYLVVTVTAILALVWLGIKGINLIKSDFLEHHNKSISGIVLILLGVLAFFIEF
jgi:hypothetical protein